MVIALAVELSGTCQLKPGLEVFGHRAVQQGALGMAGVVGCGELGLLSSLRDVLVPTRVLVRVRRRMLLWSVGRALHGAAPVCRGLALPL